MRECLRLVTVGGVGVLVLKLRDSEQLTCPGDVLGTLAAGEQAVVANAVEAAGEHMDQEAAAASALPRERFSPLARKRSGSASRSLPLPNEMRKRCAHREAFSL